MGNSGSHIGERQRERDQKGLMLCSAELHCGAGGRRVPEAQLIPCQNSGHRLENEREEKLSPAFPGMHPKHRCARDKLTPPNWIYAVTALDYKSFGSTCFLLTK